MKSKVLKAVSAILIVFTVLTAFTGCDAFGFLFGFDSSSEEETSQSTDVSDPSGESSESHASSPEESQESSAGGETSEKSSEGSQQSSKSESSKPPIEHSTSEGETSLPDDILSRITQQHGKNKDTVGWLIVPGTEIDDAVVQYKDNDYYLRKDKNKKYAYSGCYFADYESTMGDRNMLSRNTIIYGHNLGYLGALVDDGRSEKFGQLFKFLDKNFAENHPYIYFSTAEEDMVWEVFAVYYTECKLGSYKPDFKFNLVNVSNSYFEYMLTECIDRSVWDYGIYPSRDDRILTLSTCSYKYGTVKLNGVLEMKTRFNVVARLVDDDVMLHDSIEIYENPIPKQPILPKSYK